MSDLLSDRSLLGRYYLYRATMSVGFITPIFTLFLLRSLTYTQFAVLSALYSILAVISEVPTGYVGDRLGRRTSLLLSVAFTVGSVAGFVVMDGFLPYAFLYALWALALGAGVVADATTAVAALGGLFLTIGAAVWLLGSVAPKTESTTDSQTEQSLS